MEELLINDDLFTSAYFEEASYVYNKIKDWGISFDEDLLDVLQKVKDSAKKGSYIQRYKGLGEMNPEELWETTLNPEKRILLQVKYSNNTKAKSKKDQDLIQILMGDEVAPRKDFIIKRALEVSNLDI